MKIHEYQAKNLLNQTNLPIPRGSVCSSPEEAVEIANAMPQTQGWVIKAQIHAGGRGKGGGIQIAKSLEDVDAAAKMLIGKMLVTPQTGPDGTLVRKILVEEAITIINEIYVGVTVNRNTQNIVFIASVEGGTDIEEVAVFVTATEDLG